MTTTRSVNEKIALAAMQYSRSIIKECASALSTNQYSPAEAKYLWNKIDKMRSKAGSHFAQSILRIEPNDHYSALQTQVDFIQKYGCGNCDEYALLGFHYVLKEEPACRAEVARVKNGSHRILILGRDPKSNPNAPETWGEDAYICDPWAETVFPAKQYKEKLSIYFCAKDDKNIFKNYTAPFDPSKHGFKFSRELASDYICKREAKEHIEEVKYQFNMKFNFLVAVVKRYVFTLSVARNKMGELLGVEHEKFKVLDVKVFQLKKMTTDLCVEGKTVATSYLNIHQGLRKRLKHLVDFARKIPVLKATSGEDASDFEGNTRKFYARFFDELPKTAKVVSNAEVGLAEALEKMRGVVV